MKATFRILTILVITAMALTACGPAATDEPTVAPTEAPPPTEPPAEEPTKEMPMGVSCDEPIKVGLITDATGVLAIYGAHIIRSFALGMEYGTGVVGSVGEAWTPDKGTSNTFMLDDCEIEILLGDDQTNPDLTTSIAREFVEVEGVDILIGTVSSGNTATLQEIAAENEIILIVAPAAANDITGMNFNEFTFNN